jgi:secreted trypsin-like serine protease
MLRGSFFGVAATLAILISFLFYLRADDDECGDGPSNVDVRIIGGTQSKKDDWPWLVAFFGRVAGNFFCAGSLISDKHVLTGE